MCHRKKLFIKTDNTARKSGTKHGHFWTINPAQYEEINNRLKLDFSKNREQILSACSCPELLENIVNQTFEKAQLLPVISLPVNFEGQAPSVGSIVFAPNSIGNQNIQEKTIKHRQLQIVKEISSFRLLYMKVMKL